MALVLQRHLHADFGLAAHLAAQAQVVAEIDHVIDGGNQPVGFQARAIHHGNALGAHAALHAVTGLGLVDVDAGQHRAVGQGHAALCAAGAEHAGLQHRVVAHKAGHKAVDRGFVQAVHGVDLLDHAFVEHGHPVRHGEGFRLVVRHVHKRHAQAAVQGFQLDLHVLAQLFVECAQRLVHQHQLGVEHQRTGQGHALLLAARHLRGIAAAHVAHLHHVQSAFDLGVQLGLGHFAHRQRVGNVLGHRHVRKQRVVLEHHAEIALVRRCAGDLAAIEHDVARGGRLEPGQHHQRGGLARARWPQQRQELAFADVQVQILDHQGVAVVGFLDTGEGDESLFRFHAVGCFRGCQCRECRAHVGTSTYTDLPLY